MVLFNFLSPSSKPSNCLLFIYNYLSIYLPIFLSIFYISTHISIYPFIYLLIYLSTHLYIYLKISLSTSFLTLRNYLLGIWWKWILLKPIINIYLFSFYLYFRSFFLTRYLFNYCTYSTPLKVSFSHFKSTVTNNITNIYFLLLKYVTIVNWYIISFICYFSRYYNKLKEKRWLLARLNISIIMTKDDYLTLLGSLNR